MYEELKNVSIDMADTAVNNLTQNEIIKQLPVFKQVVAVIKTFNTISNQIFAKKIYDFLFTGIEISNASVNKLLKLNDKDISEKLLVILNAYNDTLKCSLFGRIAKKFLMDEISKEDFIRLGYILDRAIIEDLRYLKDIEKDEEFEKSALPDGISESLLIAGLLLDSGSGFDGARFFSISKYGKIIRDIL